MLPFVVIEVRDYVDGRGRIPYRDWVMSLDASVQARVVALRMDFGPGYRVYFGKDGEMLVILLGGVTKRRQQADIEEARMHWNDYKRRKGKGNDGTDA